MRRDKRAKPSHTLATSDAVAREDARIDGYVGFAKVAIAVLVLGFGGWAAATEISGAVVATAKIAVEANSKSVQHLEGGIVTDIAVREGQKVEKGERLIALDAGQTDQRISGLKSQARAKEDQLELLKSELDDLKALEEKRLVPRSQVAKARRDYAELEGELGRLKAELKRLGTNRRRLDVFAPLAGRVHALQVHTVGGVIKPGQEILKIVPRDARLIVEGAIAPRDIDQVARGQKVSIRLSSFNQRETPELLGTVATVSADLIVDERQQTHHYMVQILFDAGELDRLGGRSLVPGMPADIFVQTEERTVMDYLLEPLTDQFTRAMREE